MTSSTALSRPRPRFALAAAATALAFAAATHAVLEPLASHVESVHGAYLWKDEEWLQLFTRDRYADRGAGRVLVYGPSETREALLTPRLEQALPGLECLQNAQSMGTIEDGLVLLDYIDREYGPGAVPSVVVLGVSTRFVANIRAQESFLLSSIDKYAPHFRVNRRTSPPRLEPKSAWESQLAWFRFRLRQQRRYQGTLKALLREALAAANSPLADSPWLLRALSPAKYHGLEPVPLAETRAWLADPKGFWSAVHAWDPDEHRERVLRDVRGWRDFCREHGTTLYVVNMPEVSWNRDLYPAGRYERFLAVLREALADTPFLDLRMLVPDEEFYDSCHPTIEGCARVSDAVAAFVARDRAMRSPPPR